MESLENTDNLLTFISFPTRFGIAFIRQTSLSLLTKKSTSNEKEGSFPNEGGSGTLFSYPV